MDKKGKIKTVPMDKTLSDFPKYEVNPFMRPLLYMRNTRNKIVAAGKVFEVQDPETGEISDTQTMRSWVVERVDKDEFTKIYDKYLQVVFGLSPRALKLFQYFLTALKFNDERVFFDAKEATKITGYTSKQTIVSGLTELVDAEIIARSPAANIYYINPKVFVKGNRIDMIQTWVKKNTQEDHELTRKLKEHDERRKQLELFNDRHPIEQAAISGEQTGMLK